MNPPEGLSERARQRAEQLFDGRRRRAEIVTSRPEWYSQCEPGEPEAYPGGWQVRVRTWRYWSDAKVDYDADTGELMHRCVDRLSDPPTEAEMTEEEALRVAAGLMAIPAEGVLASFGHEEFAENRKVARLEWVHVHNGMRVDGDYFWMEIHPETHRLVAFGRKWRSVKLK